MADSAKAYATRARTALAGSSPRRRWQAGGAAALLLVGATALSTREFGSEANAAIPATAGGPADPASLLAQRSPGDRDPGALAQSKPYYALAPSDLVPGFVPNERVLSNERVRAPVGPAPAGPAANVAPEPLSALGAPGPLADAGVPGGATGPGVFPGVPGGGGVGFPGTGGGGGGGVVPTDPPGGDTGTPPPDTGTPPPDTGTPPPDTGTPPVNPPTGAIPEPSTWAMLIVGLFATAGMMRRRRSARAVAVAETGLSASV